MTPQDHARLRRILHEVIEDPDAGLQHLPVLLEATEHDSPSCQIAAGWALCLLVERHPVMAAYLLDRVEDRSGIAADHVAHWIRRRGYAETGAEDADEDAEDGTQIPDVPGGSNPRVSPNHGNEGGSPGGSASVTGSDVEAGNESPGGFVKTDPAFEPPAGSRSPTRGLRTLARPVRVDLTSRAERLVRALRGVTPHRADPLSSGP
jgi:hypothetical protein